MAASWRFRTCRGSRPLSTVRFENRDVSTWVRTTNPATRMHANWWTAVPALPASPVDVGYRRLWRQFADHTMNTWTLDGAGAIKPGGRGFYVEGREDHLVPAFFENFSLFPDGSWLQRICSIAEIPTRGAIEQLAWSYSYEEVLPGERRPRIADVTIMWRDELGKAVAVIEAKKPGYSFSSLDEKDHPKSGYYLRYRAMSDVNRKHQLLLIDERDRRRLGSDLRDSPSVVTWQALAAIALDSALCLRIEAKTSDMVHTRLAAHFRQLGLFQDQIADAIADDVPDYARFRALAAGAQVLNWLVGSEMYFAVRKHDAIVTAPYAWLEQEHSAAEWKLRKLQTTANRCLPIWQLR
jgi:hypothetical protein